MAARTAREAAAAFRDSLQRVLGCVVESRLNIDGYRPSAPADRLFTADLNGGDPVPFVRQPDLQLVVIVKYRIVEDPGEPGRWTPRLEKYEYVILDREENELLAYHWHPGTRNTIAWPHLHMGNVVLSPRFQYLSNAHVRTERIALEDVLWFVIRELKVPPTRRHERNWEAVLARGRREFEQWLPRP